MSDIQNLYLEVVKKLKALDFETTIHETKSYIQIPLADSFFPKKLHYEIRALTNHIVCEFHIEHPDGKELYNFIKDSLYQQLIEILKQRNLDSYGKVKLDPKWKGGQNGTGRIYIECTHTTSDQIVAIMSLLIQETKEGLLAKAKEVFTAKKSPRIIVLTHNITDKRWGDVRPKIEQNKGYKGWNKSIGSEGEFVLLYVSKKVERIEYLLQITKIHENSTIDLQLIAKLSETVAEQLRFNQLVAHGLKPNTVNYILNNNKKLYSYVYPLIEHLLPNPTTTIRGTLRTSLESSNNVFSTPETIWEWIVKHRSSSPEDVTSPGSRKSVYQKVSIDEHKKQIVIDNNNASPTKSTLVSTWTSLLKTPKLEKVWDPSSIVQMWAFGWNSHAGLVDNKPFPYKEDSTKFHLRYIPVDFNLFDSIMAELNLRRSESNTEDDTVAIYEPSDWLKEEATGAWRVHVKKDATGYNISIKNNGETTTIDLAENETVKQFAEYDWSTANANTTEDNKPRFYVSWPEKVLLQEFLKKQLESFDNITYDPNPPEVWWASFLGASNKSYNSISLQANTPFVGVGCDLLKTGWNTIDTNSPNVESLKKELPQHTSTYIPFLLYIRPADYCFNMSSKEHYTQFAKLELPCQSWQNTLCSETNNLHVFRPLQEWVQEPEQTIFETIQHSLDTELPINRQVVYGLGTLKRKWDGTEINFTDGFSATIEYTPLYKEFIEQRAKVLDPTSRALLVYLKDNTPNVEYSSTVENDIEMTSSDAESKKLIRTADKIPSSELPQKLLLSKNVILEGVPGTGKTFGFNHSMVEVWEKEIGRKVGSKDEAITMHPSTSYEDFLEGLRPTAIQPKTSSTEQNDLQIDQIHLRETKNPTSVKVKEGYFYHRVGLKLDKNLPTSNFTVADGFFLNVCKQAVQNPSKDYLILLDEINRCNIPSVFGDLLTAIERSKRATWDNDKQCWDLSSAQTIALAISKRKFFVPENVYVVGTMNTTDRSVAPMDMALRRRFAFHRIEPQAPIKDNFQKDKFSKVDTYWDKLDKSIEAMKALNTYLENWGKDALLGYSYIYDLAADLERYAKHQHQLIQHHWNHHILPQLSDIIFSNQIIDQKLDDLLRNCVTDGKHEFTIERASKSTTENSFERPHLFFSPKTVPKEHNHAPDESNKSDGEPDPQDEE